MSNHKIFSTTIEKNGYKYYVVPKGYPLFKALKTFRNANDISLTLKPNRPYFFGLKNMDPDYIYDYEQEYGVIFEYITIEPIELLALDDKQTITRLYNDPNMPTEVRDILSKHYMKSRLSESEPDRIFSNYLCESNLGLGYAIYEMETDFGGTFHPELLICNASQYVNYVKQVTTSERRIQEILEAGKLKKMTDNLEQSRKEAKKKTRGSIFYSNANDIVPKANLFGDDDTPELNGGKRRKTTNKRKKSKKSRKQTNKRRKSNNSKKRNKSQVYKKIR